VKAWLNIYRLIGAYRWALPILIVFGVIACLAESFGIGLLIPFAQAALGTGSSLTSEPNVFIDSVNRFASLLGNQNAALLLGLAVIGFIGIKTVFWLLYLGGAQRLKERAAHDARCRMMERLMATDYGQFMQRSAGDYYNVIIGESWRATEGINTFLVAMNRAVVVLILTILLLILSWKLLLFSIAVVGGSSLLVRFLSASSNRWGEIGTTASTRMSERALGIITGMRTVHIFAQEDRELAVFSKDSDIHQSAFAKMWTYCMIIGPLLEGVYVPGFVVMIFFAGHLHLPLPQLLAFLVLLFRMVPHLRAIEESRVTISRTAFAVDLVMALLEQSPPGPAPTRQSSSLNDAIVFDDVSFQYGGAGFAVANASFRIPQGKTIALVGGSGSGKSTLLALLLGLYRPESGQITIDGVPLNDIEIKSWRQRIGFAGQDVHLFPGTIADNIAYGRPDAPRADIESAARRANIFEFSHRLPHGLDTAITRDGLDLSGGQRQRIAIARALLLNPDLLILDEATNALDNITERTIHDMVKSIAHERTVLIVAHRMSTIWHADWVIALNHGRIAEQGPPQELLKQNREFARLYELEANAVASTVRETSEARGEGLQCG
jgi:subfamily B ATP-binding cassette protein MsbA